MERDIVVDRELTFGQKIALQIEKDFRRKCKNSGVDHITLLEGQLEEILISQIDQIDQ